MPPREAGCPAQILRTLTIHPGTGSPGIRGNAGIAARRIRPLLRGVRRTWLSILLIVLATFAAYAPAMRNSFVWDDTALVLRDPLIRSWRLAPEAFREFLFLDATASDFYRPLQRLTYTADYALWGIARDTGEKTGAPDTGDGADIAAIQRAPQPGWHFTSVLAHALAAVALWRFLSAWMGAGFWPLAGALIWAVHPLHTSAVTYVSGRADSLAAIFAFSALALVARATRGGCLAPGDRPAARAIIGAAVCAFAALLGKESGIAALSLWLVWQIAKARSDRRAWLAWAASAVIVLAGYVALRSTADRTPVPPSSVSTPPAVRPILAARALAEYAALFIAPHDLHMERDVSTRPMGDGPTTLRWARLREAQTLAGFAIGGLLVWCTLRARRRQPDVTLALAGFAVTWLPVSNFLTLNATVAEHWLYVPGAFLIAAGIFALRPVLTNATAPPTAIGALGAVWLLFLAAQTWRQQGYWRDQRTFVQETASRAGRGDRMLVNLGQLASLDGDDTKALALYREALKLKPDLAVAHFNIATVALRWKDFDTALAELAHVEKSPLFAADALVVRSVIEQMRTGKPQFALLAQAAEAAPRNWSICRRLPMALASERQFEKARTDLARRLEVQPFRAENARMLGEICEAGAQVHRESRRPDLAAAWLRAAAQAYGTAANLDVRDEVSRRRLQALRSLY